MSEHHIDTISFNGLSRELEEAQADAQSKLQAWYADQDILYSGDGASIFQFSTAVCLMEVVNEPPSFLFIITIFDTRRGNRTPGNRAE